MTIRKKLIFIQLLSASIVLVLASAVFVFNEIRQFRENLAKNLSSTGLLIGENSASTLVFMDNQAAEQVLSSLVVEPHIANACIYDADGQVFASYARRDEQYELPAAPGAGHQPALEDPATLAVHMRPWHARKGYRRTQKRSGSGHHPDQPLRGQ